MLVFFNDGNLAVIAEDKFIAIMFFAREAKRGAVHIVIGGYEFRYADFLFGKSDGVHFLRLHFSFHRNFRFFLLYSHGLYIVNLKLLPFC